MTSPAGKRTTVLVVEDEPVVALDVKTRLGDLGYDVVGIEATGEAALDSAVALSPDLVVMDIRLRGPLDGISAAERLKLTSEVPIVFLTAYADEETIARAAAVAPYGYVLKPFDDRALRVVLDAAVQRRALVHSLRESEAWLTATVQSTGNGVVALIAADGSGVVRALNVEAERLTGWTREAVGWPLEKVGPVAPHRSGAPALGTKLREQLLRRDGTTLPIESTRTPIVDDHGRSYGTVWVFRDITEQLRHQQAERLISETSELLAGSFETFAQADTMRAVLDKVADLVVRVLARWCIIDLLEDSGSVRAVGVSHKEADFARSLRAILTAQSRHPPELVTSARAAGGAIVIDEVDCRARLAQWLGVTDSTALTNLEADSILCIPLVAHDRLRGAMILGQARDRGDDAQDRSLIVDLSSRLALHIDSCLQYERAQRAIRVREDVLAIASHDLRSPLSTVLGNVDLILQMVPGVSALVRSRLLAVQRAGTQMRRLINDLLDAAAIEAGSFSLEWQTCHAEQLVTEAVEMHLVTAEPRSIRLTSSVKAGFKVRCDPERILQVLSNLVGNAIKFTGDGGAVVVAAEPAGQEVRFSVSDTGIGIAADLLPCIFDRYWRAAQDRRPGEPRAGAGLGLYIARGIVEAHGGEMWVESRLDKGTKVFFTLQRAAS